MQVFGWLGFVLIQLFYVPQVAKIFRTRQVTGMSLSAWVILWWGLLFYLVYSISIQNLVFILGNAAGLLQSSLVIGLLLKYGRRSP